MNHLNAMERIDRLSENHNRLRIAFWLFLGYVSVFTVMVWVTVGRIMEII